MLDRATVLDAAASELASVKQWADMESYDHALHHYTRAEMLLELIEVEDCGSVGGFDKGQKPKHRRTLNSRLAWLRGDRW